jgi:hypothetical protein
MKISNKNQQSHLWDGPIEVMLAEFSDWLVTHHPRFKGKTTAEKIIKELNYKYMRVKEATPVTSMNPTGIQRDTLKSLRKRRGEK